MKIFIGAKEELCQLMRNPVQIFLISDFTVELSNDFKCQLMMSFCLQIIRILFGKNAVSDL